MYDVPEERLNKEMRDADSYFHIVNINWKGIGFSTLQN